MSRIAPWTALGAMCWLAACREGDAASLDRTLVGRGRIAVVAAPEIMAKHPDATTLVDAESTKLAAANDAAALALELEREGFAGIYVGARGAPPNRLRSELTGYAHVPGFVGAHMSPLGALYMLDPVSGWSPRVRDALAVVARRLLGGEQPPRVASFPAELRHVQPVEVMVLLRSGEQARLWRSARGSSFARALLTASEVARKRWIEREQTMGGSINTLLPKLSVEVAMLQDDGEIGHRSAAFIDRVVTTQHGVAYERKGAWRYLLPEATHKDGRRPSAAYASLFREDGLPEDSIDNPELRLYRIAVQPLSVSPPAPRTRDALSDVASPDEVLAPRP